MAWNNQVAIITGGARGLGRASALALAAQGVAICVNYTARPDAAEATVATIKALGARAIAVQADVADAAAVNAMAARAEAELGPVTILIGVAEVAMGLWILSGIRPRTCAATQTVAIITMNTLELTLARDHLLAPIPMVCANAAFLSAGWYIAIKMPAAAR